MNGNHKQRVPTTMTYIGCGLFLLISYFFLYVTLQMVREVYLVPLRSFFNTRPGIFLLAAVVIGASALLLLTRMVRAQDRIRVILIFAVDNLLAFVLFTGLAILIHQLPHSWSPWPGLALGGTLLLVLLWAQGSGWPWRRRRGVGSRRTLAALGFLFIVALVIAFGGIIVVAPSGQAPTTGLPPSPPTADPAARATPQPLPTAVVPLEEPYLHLNSRPLHGKPPFTTTLSATAYPGVEGLCPSVRWNFGDGSEIEQPCPSDEFIWRLTAHHTYTASGTYHPRIALMLTDGRSLTSDTQTVVVAEPQPVPRFRRLVHGGVWALSLLAAVGAFLWLRGRPTRVRIIGYALVGLLLITFVPPFSYLPDPLGIVWAAIGGYAHDPRLPFVDRFLVAGSPVARLRPWLDGLIGQTGLDPLDPSAPLVRYEPVRVRVPRRSQASSVEVVIRFTYADGSRRTHAIPLYYADRRLGFYQAGWSYDGLARLRTEHRELPGLPFPDASLLAQKTMYLSAPERLPLSREAQRLDTANPSNWYWSHVGHPTAGRRRVAWSPVGDAFLARAYDSHAVDDLWLVSVDGSRPERLVGDVSDFGWSPDGRYVIFTRHASAWSMGIFIFSLEEQLERPLAQLMGTVPDDFPGVNEAGVWYASEGALWLAPYDGSPAQRIDLAHLGAKGPIRPASDGSLIAYACGAGLCLQDRAGGARRVIDAGAQQIAWSPDDSRLALIAWEGREDVLLTIAGCDGRIEHRVPLAPEGEASVPQWTPDGQRLFVQTSPFGGRRIITVDADTGVVLDLSRPRWDAWFDLAPDGEQLLLTNGRGGFWTSKVMTE